MTELEAKVDRLVSDFDHFSPTFVAGTDTSSFAYHVYRVMRDSHPVLHSERYGGFYAVTRYEDVYDVLHDHATFSSAGGITIPPLVGDLFKIPPFEFDPPEHTRYRNLLTKGLAPKAVVEFKPFIRERASEAIESALSKGTCDIVSDIIVPVHGSVIARLLGARPEEYPLFTERVWRLIEGSHLALTTDDGWQSLVEVAAEIWQHLEELAEMAAVHASDGEDDNSITAAVVSEEQSGMLTREEVIGLLFAIYTAGNETTINALGSQVHYLYHHEAVAEELRSSPVLIERFVEEMLRYEGPVQALCRTATRDVVIRGQTIPAGSKVLVYFAAANRDERQFESPGEVVIQRSPNRHAALGLGIHRCVGSHLARLEAITVLDEFLSKVGRFRLDLPNISWRHHETRGPSALPAVLERRYAEG